MAEERLRVGRALKNKTDDVRAVERTLALLRALGMAGSMGAPLAGLARSVGLTEATALRYLTTLVRNEMAERDTQTDRYSLGIGVLLIAERALGDIDPRRVAVPHMQRLRDKYGETVNLATLRNGRLILIEVLEGTQSLKRGASIGEEDPLHASALGKAVLAYLPGDQRRVLVSAVGLPRYNAKTLTTPEALEEELKAVRDRCYAVDNEERYEGLSCVAVPIFDRHSMPTFALSLSGPTARFTTEMISTAGQDLIQTSSEISRGLGCAWPPVSPKVQ